MIVSKRNNLKKDKYEQGKKKNDNSEQETWGQRQFCKGTIWNRTSLKRKQLKKSKSEKQNLNTDSSEQYIRSWPILKRNSLNKWQCWKGNIESTNYPERTIINRKKLNNDNSDLDQPGERQFIKGGIWERTRLKRKQFRKTQVPKKTKPWRGEIETGQFWTDTIWKLVNSKKDKSETL